MRLVRFAGFRNCLLTGMILLAQVGLGQTHSTEAITTVVDDKSPTFLLGKATRRQLLLRAQDNSDMSLALGARLQGTVEAKQAGNITSTDFYGRRIRFEAVATFTKNLAYVMDLRSDQVNRLEGGERGFVVGDAFIRWKEAFGLPFLNFQAFRGKIDVSRSATVTSAWQLYFDRPFVVDSAIQFVNQNRRAANVQIYGNFDNKVRYTVAIGDGVGAASFFDGKGKLASSVTRQSPMLGGKIVLSPIPGWEEKDRTMTYFGRGHHASAGVGYYRTSAIIFKPTAAAAESSLHRGLLNVEASFALGPIFLQAEYFNFSGITEDFGAATLNTGDSDGWYVTGEYVLTDFHYLAPTFRYERWNRFRQAAGYHVESGSLGVNWYLMGNSVRTGLMVQRDWFGTNLGGGTETTVRWLSQLLF